MEFFKRFEFGSLINFPSGFGTLQFKALSANGYDIEQMKDVIDDFCNVIRLDSDITDDFDVRTIVAYTDMFRTGHRMDTTVEWTELVEFVFENEADRVTFKMKYC